MLMKYVIQRLLLLRLFILKYISLVYQTKYMLYFDIYAYNNRLLAANEYGVLIQFLCQSRRFYINVLDIFKMRI